jgi:predicted RNase H-like nuclease
VPLIAGVDGRRGGWAVALVTLGAPRPAVAWHVVGGQDADGFRAVLELARDADAVGVDCPIGLPAHEWRPCDLLAKKRLGRGSARVFLTPPRPVLAASTYTEALLVARELLGGRGVSAQTYGLRRIVLAVDEVLRRPGVSGGPRGAQPPVRRDVVEVHPELSFLALAGRAPGDPLPSKKTAAGRAARLAALARWVPDAAADAPDGDDGLDALAAAWSAWRHAAGVAETLGGDVDEHGLPMRIVV